MELEPILNRLFSLFGNGTAALIGKLLELVQQRGINDPAGPARLKGEARLNLLLSKGSFEKQSVKTLRSLCKENGLKRFSGLNKSALCKLLKENDFQAPPPPLEKLTKAEQINIIHSLLA